MKYDTTRADNLLDKNAMIVLDLDNAEYIDALKQELDRAVNHIYSMENDMDELESEVDDLRWQLETLEDAQDAAYWNPQDI